MINKILKAVKKPRIVASMVWEACSKLIRSDRLYLKVDYYLHTGERLNLDKPVTFNEKTQWLKLHNTQPICTQMADKYAVRQLVGEAIGEEYLIPLLGVWDNFEGINIDSLPDKFVLKTNHDSGSVVICKDKSKFDKESARKKLTKSLKNNYFWAGREYPYKNIKPRIIAERFMENEGEEGLSDYKFFCFGGKPEILFFASDRFNKEGESAKFDYYDMDLNHLPISSRGHKHKNLDIPRTEQFEEMKVLAAKLSAGFPFLRVDFYLINGKVYFGELTFHHDGGVVPFVPEEWNYRLGEKIVLDGYNNN
jgi:hypothetical protein